jgi:hypothetical protein
MPGRRAKIAVLPCRRVSTSVPSHKLGYWPHLSTLKDCTWPRYCCRRLQPWPPAPYRPEQERSRPAAARLPSDAARAYHRPVHVQTRRCHVAAVPRDLPPLSACERFRGCLSLMFQPAMFSYAPHTGQGPGRPSRCLSAGERSVRSSGMRRLAAHWRSPLGRPAGLSHGRQARQQYGYAADDKLHGHRR